MSTIMTMQFDNKELADGDNCNINWTDVQRKNVVNNVDMSSLRAPWQNGPYKNQHIERHKNT